MISRVLVGARTDESEKVGFSMQMPKELKDKFDAYCKKNKVTMTAMLQSFMQYTVNVDEGVEKDASEMPPFVKASLITLANKALNETVSKMEFMHNSNGSFDEIKFEELQQMQNDYIFALKYLTGDKK